MSITIRYKCKCALTEQSFEMRNRREHEDIADWMEDVKVKLSKVHAHRSPLCRATAVEYLKIPAPENAPIGGVPKLDS